MNYSIYHGSRSSPSLTLAESLNYMFVANNSGFGAFALVRPLRCSGFSITHIQPIQQSANNGVQCMNGS